MTAIGVVGMISEYSGLFNKRGYYRIPEDMDADGSHKKKTEA
jgi:hypothetical protein